MCTDHGLARLLQAYREHGHKAAKINPLLPETPVTASVPEISVLSSTIKGHLDTSGELQPSQQYLFTRLESVEIFFLKLIF